jgi:prepilin peptidase CpaA
MFAGNEILDAMIAQWPIWTVTIVLVVAAVIDGLQLKVPNWITYPLIASGWIYSALAYYGAGDSWMVGLGWSLLGTSVGLGLLLPAYAVGGMGAGDVKLLAGVGAWIHSTDTAYAFAVSAIIGGIMALCMVGWKKAWSKHSKQFVGILDEFRRVRDPEKLAMIAAERKPRMYLLPYGIPIAIGTVLYFAWMGMLL